MLTPNELVLTFAGCYLCAAFGENRSRSATVRVHTDGHTHGRRSQGTRPPKFVLWRRQWCSSAKNSAHIMYWTTRYMPFIYTY